MDAKQPMTATELVAEHQHLQGLARVALMERKAFEEVGAIAAYAQMLLTGWAISDGWRPAGAPQASAGGTLP